MYSTPPRPKVLHVGAKAGQLPIPVRRMDPNTKNPNLVAKGLFTPSRCSKRSNHVSFSDALLFYLDPAIGAFR